MQQAENKEGELMLSKKELEILEKLSEITLTESEKEILIELNKNKNY